MTIGPRKPYIGTGAFHRALRLERGAFAEDYAEDHLDGCGNIGCDEGWVADCFDGLCINAEDGCELCLRRCDWCNQRKPDHQAQGGE